MNVLPVTSPNRDKPTATLAARPRRVSAEPKGKAHNERRTPKDARRNARPIAVGAANHWPRHATCGEYLRWLADNGYPLAAVEEVITGARTADEVYDE